jgi:hypothetical protein
MPSQDILTIVQRQEERAMTTFRIDDDAADQMDYSPRFQERASIQDEGPFEDLFTSPANLMDEGELLPWEEDRILHQARVMKRMGQEPVVRARTKPNPNKELWTRSTRITRVQSFKPHTCELCTGYIPEASEHITVWNAARGGVGDRFHAHCFEDRIRSITRGW